MFILLTYSIIISPLALSADNTQISPWKTWKNEPNVSVEYRQTQHNKLIEIKAKTVINSSIAGFILFIQDTQFIDRWLDNAKYSEILSQRSINENVFITQFHSKWPIKPRYMVVASKYWQNPDLSVNITINNISSIESEKLLLNNEVKNQIKIDVLSAHWRIIPNKNNTIIIEYTFTADPQGALPYWLIKRLSLRGIWKTMNNLSEQLPSSKWQSHQLPTIKELPNSLLQ